MAIADREDEMSFKDMWEDAKIRFGKQTKKTLEQQSKNQSLEDVLKELDERFNGHDHHGDGKHQRVKEFASNVHPSIHLLGGIAAQGAAVVFGPANLCFNAMHFLMDVPNRISNFYDNLEVLFEGLSASMRQFKIYQRIENVDTELKRCSHKLMIIFVDICAISIEILGGSVMHKWKIGAKIALLDDKLGVKAKLDELGRLVAYQSQISDAVTLEHVLKSEQLATSTNTLTTSTNTLVETLKKDSEKSGQRLEEKMQEMQGTLKGVHDDVTTVKAVLIQNAATSTDQKKHDEQYNHICSKLSVTPELFRKAESEFDRIWNENLLDTGSWLEGIDSYKSWANLESDDDLRLLLIGNHGTGKSNLAFNILKRLKINMPLEAAAQ